MTARLHFLGAAGTVTGSSYLVETDSAKFLVDCGLHQGEIGDHDLNFEPFPYNPAEINFLLLTHAHLDHCGLIPKLYQDGFRGKIYSTPATFDLARSILSDAAHIQEHGATDRQLEVLFDSADADGAYTLFQTHPYGQTFEPQEGIKVNFQNAGHILGSASIEIWLDGKKIVFSGDLGNAPAPLMPDPAIIAEADVVICESTYGDRNHEDKNDREQQLITAVTEGFATGGKIIIPSFAIDRTQDLLYIFNHFKNNHQLPDTLPIVLDSPLAIKVTEIYKKYAGEFDPEFQAALKMDPEPFAFPGFSQTLTKDESKTLNTLEGPAVIIAGSGMADAGRVQHHLLHHLSEPQTTVIFVGFQTPGTLGRHLTNGDKNVHVMDERVHVNAQIIQIGAFSAHADQTGLLDWLSHFKTSPTLYLTHGEDPARQALSDLVTKKLKFPTHLPKIEESFEI